MSEATSAAGTAPRGLRRLSLRANFQWTFAGNVVRVLTYWAIVMLLGKLGGPELLGRFTLGAAIVGPVLMLARLGLLNVQVTDARREYSFEQYFGTRIVMGVLAMLIIGGCAVLGPYELPVIWVILLIGLTKTIDAMSDIMRALFQQLERMNLSSISVMIKGVVSSGLCIGVFLWTRNLTLACMAMAAGALLSLIAYDLPLGQRVLAERREVEGLTDRFRPSFAPRMVVSLVARALPAGLGLFFLSLATAIPRYVLEAEHGEAQLGYFGAIAYPIDATMMIVSALGLSASPRLGNYFAFNLPQYVRLLRKLVLLSVVLGVGLVLGCVVFGEWVLTLLFRPDYAVYQPELILLSFSGLIRYTLFFGGVALMATRNFYVAMFSGIVACVVAYGSASLLVPPLGVRGAVLVALIHAVVTAICYGTGLWWLVRRRREALERERSAAVVDGNQVAAVAEPHDREA